MMGVLVRVLFGPCLPFPQGLWVVSYLAPGNRILHSFSGETKTVGTLYVCSVIAQSESLTGREVVLISVFHLTHLKGKALSVQRGREGRSS